MNMGCRIISEIVLSKNIKTILMDMKAVNSAQVGKLSTLLCNLILLAENHSLKFSAELLGDLSLMIHDSFRAGEYEKLIHLISKFVSVQDVISLLKA